MAVLGLNASLLFSPTGGRAPIWGFAKGGFHYSEFTAWNIYADWESSGQVVWQVYFDIGGGIAALLLDGFLFTAEYRKPLGQDHHVIMAGLGMFQGASGCPRPFTDGERRPRPGAKIP